MPEHVRTLADYDAWANQHIFDACRALSAEEFTRDLRSSFGSVHGTLLHIIGAQWFWLERWKGRSSSALNSFYQEGFISASLYEQFSGRPPDPSLPVKKYSNVAQLGQRAGEIERDFRQFIESLSAQDLQRNLEYTTTESNPNSQPFWLMAGHVVNHSTQYRGQVTTLLRQLGKPAVATDLIAYYREKGRGDAMPPPDPKAIRLLYAFNTWAKKKILQSCEALSEEQFTRNLGSSFPSVRDTLAHIMWADWLWLERWHGRSHGAPASEELSFAALRSRWMEIEQGQLSFLAELTPADLARISEYRTSKGVPMANPLWQSLQHVVNHSTYHRGQAAAMLRQLGVKPNFSDLIYYYREQAGQALD